MSKKTINELLEENLISEEEQPYEIPENWAWTRISNFITLERGITFPATAKNFEFNEGLIGCARTANIQEEFLWDDLIYIDKSYTKGNEKKLVRKNDILMSVANSYHLVGKVSFIREIKEDITFGGFLLCIRPNIVNDKFLYYYFRYLFLNGKIQQLATQTTNIANINAKKIQSLPMQLPPQDEQKRIVQKVERMLSKIENAKQLIEEAKETIEIRRAAILDKAFRGELTRKWRDENNKKEDALEYITFLKKTSNFNGSDEIIEPYSLPNGWKWARIGELFHVQVGSTPSRKNVEYWEGEHPWLSSGEVQFNTVDESRERVTDLAVKESRLKLAPKGSILFGMIGEGKTRGQVALLNLDAYHNQNIASIWVSKTKISSLYVYYWLMSQYNKNRQNSAGNNQPAYNKSRVQELLIPIAPLDEIEVITNQLQKILNLEGNINNLLFIESTINDIRQSVLSKAFRGELGTNDPCEPSAIKLLKEVLQEQVK
jgi:type I restriction enzyme, S subunit